MSVHVLARFMTSSSSTLGARLVGIVIADSAGDDGICWLSQDKLQARSMLSQRAVRDAIRSLERLGEIQTRRAQRGRARINVYRLWCAASPQYDRLPFELDEPFDERQILPVQNDRRVVPLRPADFDADDRQFSVRTPLTERKGNQTERKSLWKVDRTPVSTADAELALDVLNAWNKATSQSLTSRDWLSKIVMRIREHPELELGDHVQVIHAALADPWWSGPATPSVVYGSGAQFERALLLDVDPAANARESFMRVIRRASR